MVYSQPFMVFVYQVKSQINFQASRTRKQWKKIFHQGKPNSTKDEVLSLWSPWKFCYHFLRQ